jgi:RNA polymerase sigma-70 factor (ECF subfamily)
MRASASRLSAPAFAVLLLASSACRREVPEIAVSDAPGGARVPAAPRAIALDPPNGAVDVDPSRTSITVTFDREMDREGWAWVVENPTTSPETGESRFDPTGRSNTVEVRLEPGRSYVVWVNSPDYPYFRDPTGVPATPVRWTFSTRGSPSAAAAANAPIGPIAAHGASGPSVVSFDPPNGAIGVDSSRTELRATFDRPMSQGWSWVREGEEPFPEPTGEAALSADGRVAILPVRLERGRSYVVWLNKGQYRFFRDAAGQELAPVRWTFSTAP